MMSKHLYTAVFMLLTLAPWPVHALVDGYRYDFESAQQAQRFEQLLRTLRCPVCQNQDLSDSNSQMAIDLRDKVFELMLAGHSDDDITDFLVARYGAFVRYQPAFNAHTWLLWLGPMCLLGLGLLMWWRMGAADNEPTNER